MNTTLTIFWFIVALIHIILVVRHYFWLKQSFSKITDRPTIKSISGVPLNIKESLEDINIFINHLNKHNREVNTAQLWGYMAGLVASGIGFILSLQSL